MLAACLDYRMSTPHARTEILIGAAGIERLRAARVLVAGLGGVGGYAAEALGRSGIGHLTLLDHDVVSSSNLNRQLLALHSTLGRPKAAVMAERLHDIDPRVQLTVSAEFLSAEGAATFLAAQPYDAVVDCIDSIACKAALVAASQEHAIFVASALGAGNCLDVRRVQVTTLQNTQGCPLARELRHRLRKRGATLDYPVIYSDEMRRTPLPQASDAPAGQRRAVNGTISYLPAMFGVMLAGVVIQHLLTAQQAPQAL